MPTYEYRCPRGHAFEVFQRMSDEPVASCPDCGEASQRVLSAGAGFLFKGEGFYITDYRSAEYRKKAEAERGTAPAKSPDGKAGEGKGSAQESSKKEGRSARGEGESPSGSSGSTSGTDG